MSETSKTPRRSWPWLKITLFVSLAVNLMILGLVAGTVLGKKPGERTTMLRDLGYGPFISALPREDRREIGQEIRDREGSFRKNRAEFRREFEAFLTVLRSDPLDEAALRQAVERQRGQVTDRMALGQALLLEQIRDMTPDARAAYADELDKLFKRRPKGPPKGDR